MTKKQRKKKKKIKKKMDRALNENASVYETLKKMYGEDSIKSIFANGQFRNLETNPHFQHGGLVHGGLVPKPNKLNTFTPTIAKSGLFSNSLIKKREVNFSTTGTIKFDNIQKFYDALAKKEAEKTEQEKNDDFLDQLREHAKIIQDSSGIKANMIRFGENVQPTLKQREALQKLGIVEDRSDYNDMIVMDSQDSAQQLVNTRLQPFYEDLEKEQDYRYAKSLVSQATVPVSEIPPSVLASIGASLPVSNIGSIGVSTIVDDGILTPSEAQDVRDRVDQALQDDEIAKEMVAKSYENVVDDEMLKRIGDTAKVISAKNQAAKIVGEAMNAAKLAVTGGVPALKPLLDSMNEFDRVQELERLKRYDPLKYARNYPLDPQEVIGGPNELVKISPEVRKTLGNTTYLKCECGHEKGNYHRRMIRNNKIYCFKCVDDLKIIDAIVDLKDMYNLYLHLDGMDEEHYVYAMGFTYLEYKLKYTLPFDTQSFGPHVDTVCCDVCQCESIRCDYGTKNITRFCDCENARFYYLKYLSFPELNKFEKVYI